MPLCVIVTAKRNVSPANNPATRSQPQAGGLQLEGHDRACHPAPRATSNEPQRNSRGIGSKELKNGGRNLVHSQVAFTPVGVPRCCRRSTGVGTARRGSLGVRI